MNLKQLNPFLIIAAISTLCMLPSYGSFFGGHDAVIHGMWTRDFAKILASGNLFPRYAGEMNMGFGSYIFAFYPPVSLYLNSIFAFLGHNRDFYYGTIRASAQLAILASGISCYYWLKPRAGQLSAMLAALIYMTLPIHLDLDFYVTCVLSQFWCYAWFPLIMLGTDKIINGQKYGFIILSISGALLALTNIPMTIIFPPFAVLYGLVQIKTSKQFFTLTSAWIMAIALSAFYVMPVITYQHLVNVDLHWTGERALKYSEFFLNQKLMSNEGDDPHRFIVLLCFILTMMFAFLFTAILPKSRTKIFLLLTCAVIAFMSFSISKPVWELLPMLQKVQFPRRLLVIPTIIIPFAAASADKNRLKAITVCNLIFLIMIIGVKPNTRAEVDDGIYQTKQDIFMHDMEIFPNYFPAAASATIPYFYDEYPFNPELTNHPKIAAPGKFEITKWQNGDIQLNISGKAGDEITIRQFWYPAWKAELDGENLKTSPSEKFKILKIVLPHDVSNKTLKLKLQKLPAEIYGSWISLISLLIWFGLIMFRKCRASN